MASSVEPVMLLVMNAQRIAGQKDTPEFPVAGDNRWSRIRLGIELIVRRRSP